MTPGEGAALLARLRQSRFRARFHLGEAERRYLALRGMADVMDHAAHFVAVRLSPAEPPQDGRQTPMRGHPVFIAQHATATCCRSCLAKWHGYRKGVALDAAAQAHVLAILRAWLEAESVEDEPVQGRLF
ncbi:DUF4186 domain-containing protein [Acidomonas methanolica]|uniref:DUF4186 domain-containing protein n=1 Tax=Acidomonas methanolica NBRC 104435 TaxID=1231351 RepID=A0A023D5U7_ACIMT|nr:DUF4186 domain-containing protein [Acidomonas methanolica]MBU2655614.1 DUF4186 domain-containing protein [Acidomonas methanolica]TCS21433.1 uncharacterized protein DUF4186 [Acidomonas methanolica]GAJ29459.1 hypothetical protein Amme_061_011 [Acidomonas methanolica NBRC 104435]GBQ48121.1 hypothetical protein AA0498_0693 [Acidomonas methanolica]GEL00370.1 DUF4186 domain-containing protein [Acidomonas methanolica NBRC 104435]